MTTTTEPEIISGDCLDVLRGMDDNSVDAIVTDPPYGLSKTNPKRVAETITKWITGDTEYTPPGPGFMGKTWDSFVPPPAVWVECMRVLKPGGHMTVFAGARTQDLMGLSIRLAGFDIRDTLGWIYGSGFPKSHDVSKALDKAAGAEREVVGVRKTGVGTGKGGTPFIGDSDNRDITAPTTPEAKQWDGWGTALKPAIEPIILARKPLSGTVANNVLEHGVGGLNIDASRVGTEGGTAKRNPPKGSSNGIYGSGINGACEIADIGKGRFPANVLLDECAAAEVDKQSTGASRFYPAFRYQAKAPKRERPVIEREDGTKVQHPTVKPVTLMEWLVTLITPPGGVVLDPFAGSGATLQAAYDKGHRSVGIEQSSEYCELIRVRLNNSER